MPLILGTNSIKDTGFNVSNSLRFNTGSSDSLTRTDSSGSSRRIFTYSVWVKRTNLSKTNADMILNNAADESNQFKIELEGSSSGDDHDIRIRQLSSGSENISIKTSSSFRDVSAWYHIVVAVDTTQSTDSNRVKLYVNGSQITSFSSTTYPSQNSDMEVNVSDSYTTHIGKRNNNDHHFEGHMCEFVFIDGTALAPTSFGEFDDDSGIWKPIDVSGLTFGNNGFYLQFKESGTSANSSGIGADTSGNTSHFTVNNLTAIDQGTDTCTNNFAILNSLDGAFLGNSTFSEGGLRFNSEDGSNKCWMRSTIGVTSGKWYFEAKVQTAGNNCAIGITDRPSASLTNELGGRAFEYSYQSANSGNKLNNGSGSSYGDTYTDDDIVSCALDLDNLKIYFGKNGTFQNSGDPTSGATGTGAAFTVTAPSLTVGGAYFFALGDLTGANNVRWLANFGSAAPFTISSGNTDGEGFGNFEFAVPSGYFALCTKNLAEYGG